LRQMWVNGFISATYHFNSDIIFIVWPYWFRQ